MKKVLLVNPAVYDFTAYDFWLRPYGLLQIGGMLQNACELTLFDYMDRAAGASHGKTDIWQRGPFKNERTEKPSVFKDIPRYYKRFGRDRTDFQNFLKNCDGFGYVLIQTVMTYWYPGVAEAIEDVRTYCPGAKIILGGVYASICPEHAKTLGADLVIQGTNLSSLFEYMNVKKNNNGLAWWQGYKTANVGAIKITDGCPFKCTYCSVPKFYPRFSARNLKHCLSEFELMTSMGITNIAFYDDALLFKADDILVPFLKGVAKINSDVNFHTPNALNARFITEEFTASLVEYGFKTFYIGFESSSADWQNKTGGKVSCDEFENAVNYLVKAGADRKEICAYQIFGHPSSSIAQAENSLKFVNSLGVRVMLADFSPIPGTADGDVCGKWTDMAEPLNHNKTAFVIKHLGFDQTSQLKQLCKELNRQLNF
jgi:hypothetical protein